MTAGELAPEELWLLERYVEGWSRAEMAAHARVGPRVVQTSLDSARRKLGARSLGQAATLLLLMRRGLLGEGSPQAV